MRSSLRSPLSDAALVARAATLFHQPAGGVPVAAHVGGVPGDDDHMARAYGDSLLAAGADVGLARLSGMDPPDIEAEGFARGGQVGDLL